MTVLQLFPDLICVAVILMFLIFGYSRGMFRTLSGVMTWLVSLFGAKFIAGWGAPLTVDLLLPGVEPYVQRRLAEAMAESVSSSSGGGGDLGVLGLIPGVQDLLEGATEALAGSIAPAIAREVAQAIGWVILFVVGFLALKLVCRLAVLLLDLLDRIPGLHLLNHLGGALLGGLKGLILLCLAVWVLLLFGLLPLGLVDGTVLLRWMAELSGIY